MILRLKGFSKIIFLLLLNSSVATSQEALPGLNGDFVDYPELQNSFERDLSYESRIKKLRTTVKTLDDTIKATLKLKSSVFEIEKGKEDKRVKVIRLKDQRLRFSKLRSLLPF
jgi:hypothetical protein